MTDAYFSIDRDHDLAEQLSDARAEWLEVATENLLEEWKRQLNRDDYIEDLGWQYDDVVAYCVERNLPYDKGLFDLAWNHLEQSDRYGELSWS